MKHIALFLFLSFVTKIEAQQLYFQETYNGGATGTGYSWGISNGGSGQLELHIAPGSTIKKAFLFCNRYYNAKPVEVSLGNDVYIFNSLNQISPNYDIPMSPSIPFNSAIHGIDVTQSISSLQNIYNFNCPPQYNDHLAVKYGGFYLLVLYKNDLLPKVSLSIILNNKDQLGNVNYPITGINPMNNLNPIGLAIHTDIIWDTILDGSYISINNQQIGLIGGSDAINITHTGGGVKGCFYYENELLYGLDDDTPDNIMEGTDGLADISPYINNNDIFLNIKMQKQLPSTPFNIYTAYFLTYTSPCDTFSTTLTSDTTICQGEQIQLNATGGQSYKWTPLKDTTSNDLSCINCPNPIFSGDSSAVYTVRIWNNDSCSVVKPVRITVLPTLKNKWLLEETPCGASLGEAQVNTAVPSASLSVFAVTESGDTLSANSNKITSLAAGNYTVFYINANGCRSADTTVTIESYNNTKAVFVTHPLYGKAPLQVDLENNSQNADHFSWWLNGEEQPNPFNGFTADTSGNYKVQLIAWQYDKSCADTVERTIWVYDNTLVKISGAISPNGDGKNDVFYIDQLDKFPGTMVWIYNRWGGLVYHSDDYQNDWNGIAQSNTAIGGKKLPEGTYYYVIELGGNVVAKEGDKTKTGYVYLKR